MRTLRTAASVLVLTALAVSPAKADPLKVIAKHLAKSLAKAENHKIVVLPFPYHDGSLSSGSSIVSERLTNFLAERSEVQVIERSLLSKIMGEMKLEESGAVNPASTQKIGKVLGAGAIVTGTLIDLEDGQTEVNARLIQTESGVVLAASTERITRTWTDLPHPVATTSEAPAETTTRMKVDTVDLGYGAPPRRPAEEDVLTLTNKDLEHSESLPPAPNDFAASIMEKGTTENPNPLAALRRIYQRNPNPRTRAMALLDIGILLERRDRPKLAAQAYSQLLREFPSFPRLVQAASSRLQALGR
jgi:TolB-like protein